MSSLYGKTLKEFRRALCCQRRLILNDARQTRYLYVFLDEGGDLNFSKSGTCYFTLTAISKERPFTIEPKLLDLKHDLIEFGLNIEYFHASEDRQAVRDRVFRVIQEQPDHVRADTIVVEKPKTGPSLQVPEYFYPRMLGYLLKYIFEGSHIDRFDELIVITDSLPVKAKRRAFEKGIKKTLAQMLPKHIKYRLLHHASKSSIGLQIADYFNWAVFRKWEGDDTRSHDLIKTMIHSEFEIFRSGTKRYY